MTSSFSFSSWRSPAVLCLAFLLLGSCAGRYIITTPREWMKGGTAQVCVEVDDPSAPAGRLTLSANRTYYFIMDKGGRITMPDISFVIPQGRVNFCENIQVPNKNHYSSTLWIRGKIGGENLNRTLTLNLRGRIKKTFIQTDKFLYQPGQKVHVRILSMFLTNLTVSTEEYPMVWVTTPSRTRVAQWTKVDNTAGLVHLQMTLADEPEQGQYKIRVKRYDGETQTNHFEVKEYNVPKFEVTVLGPDKFLASDATLSVKLCARYTYGQPLKGTYTLEISNGMSRECWMAHNITGQLAGCAEVSVAASSVRLVDCEVRRVVVSGVVVEEGTGVQMYSGDKVIPVSRQAVFFDKVYQDAVKRVALPYMVKVSAERPDGTPAVGAPVEMCKGDVCFNITVPSDGMIVTSVGDEDFKTIRMKHLNTRIMLDQSQFSTQIKRYFSPSNSSVLIYTPERKLKCSEGVWGSQYLLPVLYVSDQPSAVFTVQVISKFSVQYYVKTQEFTLSGGELPVPEAEGQEPLEPPPLGMVRGIVYIPITLNNSISPSAKVLVWMVRPDGEVVSDAKDVEVEWCLPNQAELVWSQTQVEPGQDVEMRLISAPNSLCSLGVVDKGTLLLDKRSRTLTLENIFKSLEINKHTRRFEPHYDNYQYCKNQLGGDDKGDFFSKYYDALGMLTGSGLHVLSDLVLETRPCQRTPRRLGFYDSDVMRHHTVSYSGLGLIETRGEASGNRIIGSSHIPTETKTRTDFPETWLWELFTLPNTGVYSSSVTVPDSITEWVGEAVCVHPEQGLGLSPLTNLTTFTPFFLDLTLPPSIKRGETLGVLISIFNYLDTSLPVKVEVYNSHEYDIIKDPSTQNEGAVVACVEGISKVVLEVKVKPTVIGQVNITVGASVDHQGNSECVTSAPGTTRSDRLVKPITVKAEGFLREKTWNKYICAKDVSEGSDSLGRWSVEAPGGIVEGSDRGWVTVVGSLLSVSLENLGHLIRMPYGCGEQNMVNFAPNVFILQYLSITRQETPQIKAKLLQHMNTGYQRQLLYLRSNGSYSAFGNADALGSTWLTAFVVKSFAQAQEFITIDSDSLRDSMDWLNTTQAEDGCFNSVGQVFSKALKGGLDGQGREALTSYVLISLLEAGEERNSSSVVTATLCLLSQANQHPYNLALKAYALALVGEAAAEKTLKALLSQAVVTSNATYWDLPKGHSRSDSLLVETAGYAVLAMLTLDAPGYAPGHAKEVRKVIKWITAQRNGQGGFYTTQDTVVALQALAKYEATQYQEDMDLVATVKGSGIDHSFAITEDNKLVTQRAPLTSLPTSLSLTMVGQGCAVFQSVLRYNVYEPDSSDTFGLTINTDTAADRTCTTKRIKACAVYLLPGQNSNMGVISVDLISGYVPLKEDLKAVVADNPTVVKRYEVDGSQVSFYVDEFVQGEEVCVRMRVSRLVDVDGTKPGSVTVYDYYQPEFSVSKNYRLPSNDQCIYTS